MDSHRMQELQRIHAKRVLDSIKNCLAGQGEVMSDSTENANNEPTVITGKADPELEIMNRCWMLISSLDVEAQTRVSQWIAARVWFGMMERLKEDNVRFANLFDKTFAPKNKDGE